MPKNIIINKPNESLIPDMSPTGLTITVPTVGHWDVVDRHAYGVTKAKKIGRKENICIGTWNVSTLSPVENLEELTHEM